MTNRGVSFFELIFYNNSECAEQNYDVILDTLTAYDWPWRMFSYVAFTDIFIVSHSNFNDTEMLDLQLEISILQMTLT